MTQCSDMAGDGVAGINHCCGAGLSDLPAEKAGIEILSFPAIATTDFEVNNGLSQEGAPFSGEDAKQFGRPGGLDLSYAVLRQAVGGEP
jgi:hypothetical protein